MSNEPAQRSALEATFKTAFAPAVSTAHSGSHKSYWPADITALCSHRAPDRPAYGRSYRLYSPPDAADCKAHAPAFGLTDGAAITAAFVSTQWTAISSAFLSTDCSA